MASNLTVTIILDTLQPLCYWCIKAQASLENMTRMHPTYLAELLYQP